MTTGVMLSDGLDTNSEPPVSSRLRSQQQLLRQVGRMISLVSFLLLLVAPRNSGARQVRVVQPGSESSPALRFDRIGRAQGLATMPAFVRAQDQQGYLWVGSWHGLYRYDGYGFEGFWHDAEDPTSIGPGWIDDILIDRNGNRWVTTKGSGLNRFDPSTASFLHFRHDPATENSLSSDDTGKVLEDSDGLLWIATDYGLNKLDPRTGHFTRYVDDTAIQGDASGLVGSMIRVMFEDDRGTLWVGTGNPFVASGHGALNRYDRERDAFTAFQLNIADPGHPANYVQAITTGREGKLWVSTWAGGLYEVDEATGAFQRKLDISLSSRAYPSGITDIAVQPGTNVLWIATYGSGLFRYDWTTETLANYRSDFDDPYTLGDDRVWDLFFDREGLLWLGTHSGLNKVDPAGLLQMHRLADAPPTGARGAAEAWVTDIKEGYEGQVWLGTSAGVVHSWDPTNSEWTSTPLPVAGCLNWNTPGVAVTPRGDGLVWVASSCGLFEYDPREDTFSRFAFAGDPPSIRSDQPLRLVEDHNGSVWITAEPLIRVNPETGAFTVFANDPDDAGSLSSNDVDALMVGRDGTVWVGTNRGLNRFNVATDSFDRVLSTLNVSSQPISIRSIHQGDGDDVWVSTDVTGIIRFDPDSGERTYFTVREGLHTNTLLEAARDSMGSLWGFSPRGVSVLNPETGAVETFESVVDGFVPMSFSGRATSVGRDGVLYVGGRGGFNAFDPAHVVSAARVPEVVLTDLFIRGERVRPGDDGPLSVPIAETSEVVLGHEQNEVTLGYVAIVTRSPQLTRYRYRLDGVDDRWVDAGSERSARYPNLAPGEYTFRVAAAGRLGAWSESPTAIRIIVRPPWWRTTWAYALFAALLVGLLYILRRYEMNRLEFKNRARLERVEADSLRELDKAKSQFFTNISHEFRTPLTLLLGPVSDAIDRGRDLPLRELPVIRRNAERLLLLVNQLLDLARLESHAVALRPAGADLVPFLKTVLFSFESLADQKGIELALDAMPSQIAVDFDRDKLEQVFFNLLANALRFTDAGGTVSLYCRMEGEDAVMVEVRDTGAGIPASRVPYLFDRFFQVDTDARSNDGSGIGLALTKALVELHGGTISVRSEEGVGTTFAVLLPRAHPEAVPGPALEAVPQADSGKPGSVVLPDIEVDAHAIREDTQRVDTAPERDVVLVIEDSDDVRAYVLGHLSEEYHVLEASDGAAGLDLARESIPDLIVTDVMMPKMDGYSVARALREDERTSHIPIVMLTAKATEADKLEGLDTGVDDYLLKPFSPRELRVRVRNLIAQRKRLRERFSTATVIRPSEIAATTLDEQFLGRVVAEVEAHLDDEYYTVSGLASSIGLSVSQLNRKLNGLIDQSAGRLMRSMRLQRAADLLVQRAGTVSEIAYRAGFSSPSHFSTAFKKQFGVSPSEYADSAQEVSDE